MSGGRGLRGFGSCRLGDSSKAEDFSTLQLMTEPSSMDAAAADVEVGHARLVSVLAERHAQPYTLVGCTKCVQSCVSVEWGAGSLPYLLPRRFAMLVSQAGVSTPLAFVTEDTMHPQSSESCSQRRISNGTAEAIRWLHSRSFG